MADLKISQLTGATTPLAGTEVLPIVQSGSTRKVSVANLTAGRTQTSNGIVQGTAGTGYNFTANTPAAGMTSQLLNWYEEGTWTPVLSFGGASTGIAYVPTYTNGRYTRIGNRVFVQAQIILSNKGSASGAAAIGGLPFTSFNALDASPAATLAFRNITYTGQFQGLVIANSTRIELFDITEAGAVSSLSEADFSNSSEIQISANYCV